MIYIQSFKGASSIARILKSNLKNSIQWRLRWSPVCSSTEKELSNWLREKPFLGNDFRAVFSGRQLHGKGQAGRRWCSPYGGVWVSASMPCSENIYHPELIGLALAVSLSKRIEKYNVPVKIKWPNDLMVGKNKIAGFLPKLISRGNLIRYARLGIGLNIYNKVPRKGLALKSIASIRNLRLDFWSAEVLFSIEESLELISLQDSFLYEIENRLWSKEIYLETAESPWKIEGIASNGGLIIKKGIQQKILRRWNNDN